MKKIFIYATLVFFSTGLQAYKQKTLQKMVVDKSQKVDFAEVKVEIFNPSNIARNDELIVFTREELENKLGKIADNKFVIVHSKNPIAVQLDDLNGDGKWDEAAFLYSFSPKQKSSFLLSIAEHPSAVKVAQRAHVRLTKKGAYDRYGEELQNEIMPPNAQPNDFTKIAIPLYQVEGPVWENDKVAFRSYFDIRNAKDIFGKTTTAMVMDTVGTFGDKYYHTFDKNWGMDILKVGNSLGAGGIAISINKKGKDTLLKLAGNNFEQISYEVIANGPVRSIFRMHYKNWKVAGNDYDVTEEISIWGGQYFYQDKISISPEANVVTGIVNLHSKQSYKLKKDKMNILYTLDKQSENADYLGMGIIAGDHGFKKFGKAPLKGDGITNTYTVEFKKNNEPVIFRFFSAWEKSDSRFKNRKYFENILVNESNKWSEPVIINWIK